MSPRNPIFTRIIQTTLVVQVALASRMIVQMRSMPWVRRPSTLTSTQRQYGCDPVCALVMAMRKLLINALAGGSAGVEGINWTALI